MAGQTEDHPARSGAGAALAVSGGVALAAARAGAPLVSAAEGAAAGRGQSGSGWWPAQTGPGVVPGGRSCGTVRPAPVVSQPDGTTGGAVRRIRIMSIQKGELRRSQQQHLCGATFQKAASCPSGAPSSVSGAATEASG